MRRLIVLSLPLQLVFPDKRFKSLRVNFIEIFKILFKLLLPLFATKCNFMVACVNPA
jgi:hypothetical protein